MLMLLHNKCSVINKKTELTPVVIARLLTRAPALNPSRIRNLGGGCKLHLKGQM